MTLDGFIAALEGLNAEELYVEDLLDTLWLAQLDCKLTLDKTAAPEPVAPTEGERKREREKAGAQDAAAVIAGESLPKKPAHDNAPQLPLRVDAMENML